MENIAFLVLVAFSKEKEAISRIYKFSNKHGKHEENEMIKNSRC